MRRVEFYMTSGYVGTDEFEIFEFPDDTTDEEIEEELETWFWDNFCGGYSWEECEEKA